MWLVAKYERGSFETQSSARIWTPLAPDRQALRLLGSCYGRHLALAATTGSPRCFRSTTHCLCPLETTALSRRGILGWARWCGSDQSTKLGLSGLFHARQLRSLARARHS